MSSTGHSPELLNAIEQQAARISRAVQGQHDLMLGSGANNALLDHPAGRFNLDLIDTGGTWSCSYVRNPGARYVRLELRVNASTGFGLAYVQVDLTVRDAAGHSVGPTNARIPHGFKGAAVSPAEYHYAPLSSGGPIVDPSNQILVVGYVDCDALDDDLTDPNWSFDFLFAFNGGAEVNSLQGCEMPRFVCDDLATHGGAVPGNYQRDVPISDDAQKGLERLLETLASARQVQRTYVSLAWRQQVIVSTETPNTTSTSYQYLAVLDSTSAPQTWQLRARQVSLAATAGEAIRFRVLYRMSGGAAQKGRFRLSGNATGSPWETGDLSYTTTWTWSAWITAAIRTSPTTDTLYLEARIESGATLWCAGVDVREAVA